jgi:hypothetical protein
MPSDETPNNKLFWIFSVLAVVLVVTAGFVIAGLMMSSGDDKPTPNETATKDSGYSLSDTPPEVTEVTTSTEESDITFNVVTDSYDASKYFLEYELADESRVVKATDYERSNQFSVTTKITGSSSYRLKVRLSDKERTSEWGESFTVKISDVKGVQNLQPEPAYFDTPWAKGEGSEENLKTALMVAYNAESLTEFTTNSCIPLNTGSITPGLLLPPVPGVFPKGLSLSYNINSYNPETNQSSLTYYWCSK